MRKTSSWVIGGFVVALGSASSAQLTTRVSVAAGGADGNGHSYSPSLSADGRYVVFDSDATNLVPGDTNGLLDIFLRDRHTGTTERVSVAIGGAQGNGHSWIPSISADGRYAAFESLASNLVVGDTNGTWDIFVRDFQAGTTERVSVDSGGAQGVGASNTARISGDGRFVALSSLASNLVAGDTNGFKDVFVRDRQLGLTERVSVDSSGAQGNAHIASYYPTISADGRYVAFASPATNLVAADTNGVNDIFVRDRLLGTTGRASVDSSSAQANGASLSPYLSEDGRYLGFQSLASNLVAGDSNAFEDVFLRDLQLGATERISVGTGGVQAGGASASGLSGAISADGRYVAFSSLAPNLAPGDVNTSWDVFLRDRQMNTTELVSIDSGGAQGDGASLQPAMSSDGRHVVFRSDATNLVSGDTNGRSDIFVDDRAATSFRSVCEPGAGGVIACPCANPPSGAGQGCNNSAATGGASLEASGAAYLSQDTLVFTTSGEKPTALSVVWQAPSPIPAGTIMGQGVRCGGGPLKRLYIKPAVGGSITAPNFGAGDPTVSARSAALGVPISGGQSMVYFVSYRDPIVLGGCPPTATFNLTQNGSVEWWY